MDKNNILIFNAGSSSIKFSIINLKTQESVFKGLAESIGNIDARITFSLNGQKITEPLVNFSFDQIFSLINQQLEQQGFLSEIIAVGHRVVHGGEAFLESIVVDEPKIEQLNGTISLAPLHNPHSLQGIICASALMPNLPQVAVFDTSFHQTMPEHAFLYALPYAWYTDHQIRRYGFHGTSYAYLTEQLAKKLGKKTEDTSFLAGHLGNGCSVCAIQNGKSVDTSMGLTPSEGLVMGTRAGLIDPILPQFIHKNIGLTLDQISDTFNNKSGMLGISGISNDIRPIHEAADQGNHRAKLAREIFAYQLAKQMGAFMTTLSHMDALVFAGGIGEKDEWVREKVISQLEIFGFKLNPEANDMNGAQTDGIISANDSRYPIMIISTNEELMIAQETFHLINTET